MSENAEDNTRPVEQLVSRQTTCDNVASGPSQKKEYSEEDMLFAFQHGRAYEPLDSDCDIDFSKVLNKHKPFLGVVKKPIS